MAASPPSSPSAKKKKRPNTYTDKHGQITVWPEPAVKKTKKYKEGAKDYRDSVNELTGEPIGYWRNYEKMKEQQEKRDLVAHHNADGLRVGHMRV